MFGDFFKQKVMEEQEEKMLNRFLLAIAAILFVIGVVVGNYVKMSLANYVYSFSLMACVAFLNINWVPEAEDVEPFNKLSENVKIFCKLLFAVVFQLCAIYFISNTMLFFGAVILGWSIYVWSEVSPAIYNGDAAGNGMARGFGVIIDIAKSIIFALVYFLVCCFVESEISLMCCRGVFAFYLLSKVILGYYSRTVGRYAQHLINERSKFKRRREEYMLRFEGANPDILRDKFERRREEKREEEEKKKQKKENESER